MVWKGTLRVELREMVGEVVEIEGMAERVREKVQVDM